MNIRKENLKLNSEFSTFDFGFISSSKRDFWESYSNNLIKNNLLEKQNLVTENILSFFNSDSSFKNFSTEKVRRVLNKFPCVLFDFDGTFVEDLNLHEKFCDLVLRSKFPNNLMLNYHRKIYYDFLEKTNQGKIAFLNSEAYLNYQSAGRELDLRYGRSFLGISKHEMYLALEKIKSEIEIKPNFWKILKKLRENLDKNYFYGEVPIICHTQNFGVLTSFVLEFYREDFLKLGFRLSQNHLALNFKFDKNNLVNEVFTSGTSAQNKAEFIPNTSFYITDEREFDEFSPDNFFNLFDFQKLEESVFESKFDSVLKLDKIRKVC